MTNTVPTINPFLFTIASLVVIVIAIIVIITIIHFAKQKQNNEDKEMKEIREISFKKKIHIEIYAELEKFIKITLDKINNFDPVKNKTIDNMTDFKNDVKNKITEIKRSNTYIQFLQLDSSKEVDELLSELESIPITAWEKKCGKEIERIIYGK